MDSFLAERVSAELYQLRYYTLCQLLCQLFFALGSDFSARSGFFGVDLKVTKAFFRNLHNNFNRFLPIFAVFATPRATSAKFEI